MATKKEKPVKERKCPYCGTIVQAEDKVCPKCVALLPKGDK